MRIQEVQFINGVARLPNGDVWLGFDKDRKEREDNVEAVAAPTTPDDAVAQTIAAQLDKPEYECVWCGHKFPKASIDALREHIVQNHRSVFGSEDAEKAALSNELAIARGVEGSTNVERKSKVTKG